MTWDTAIQQWQEGQRRLSGAPAADHRALEAVTEAIVAELRRRLGGPFTTEELAELYAEGTDWCLDLAVSVAPEDPRAWEAGTVADAAFWRYVHEAADFGGGRRLAR